MVLGISDYVEIALAGVGVLMGTFGRNAVRFVGVALIVIGVGGAVAGRFISADSQSLPPIINNAPSINTFNQSGGSNTVNVGPQPRNLDSPWGEPLKAQILRDLPRDQEIIVVGLMGDAESDDLAVQIYNFMKSNGFKMKRDEIAVAMYVPPPHGLRFNPKDNTFIVGAK